jgi:hypothetical protein
MRRGFNAALVLKTSLEDRIAVLGRNRLLA